MSKVEELLQKWYIAKKEKAELEAKCLRYRNKVESHMNAQNIDILTTSSFKVKLSSIVRTTISRDSVPKDIWDKYSKRSHSDSLRLTKNNL